MCGCLLLHHAATEHAQRALDLNDGMWQCHQWYAIALGSQIKHESIQRKVTAGHEYKVGVVRDKFEGGYGPF